MNIIHLFSKDSEIDFFNRISKFMSTDFSHYVMKVGANSQISTNIDVVHAHSWMEVGFNAVELSQKYDIPYIITLSQEDLKKYKKTPFFKRKNICSILENASEVIFTNPYQQNFIANYLPSDVADKIFEHSVLLIEPIDNFWIENIRIHPPTALVNIKLLYVGEIREDSHLITILNSVDKLKKKNYQVSLTAVETSIVNSCYRNKIKNIAEKRQDFELVSLIENSNLENERLLHIYRNSDISILLNDNIDTIERFGEATTQGLPVIHTSDSAFSGILNDKLTDFSVSRVNSSEIADLILEISNSFATIEQHIAAFSPFLMFDAKETAYRYEHLYDNVCVK